MSYWYSMTDYRRKLNERKQSVRRNAERGKISDGDADRILEWIAAYDPEDMTTAVPTTGEYSTDTQTKKASTLKGYIAAINRAAKRLQEGYGLSLSEADADDINRYMSDIRSGEHPSVGDSGLANNTIRNAQGYIRKFYRYHDDLGVDAEKITLISGDDTHVDDRDMLTGEEIKRVREAAEHPRDLAIFDLLIYTGQRNTAVRSLRIKDIDLENGVYYLNSDVDGLKGADENGKKRPLLGSVGSIREWLRYHPEPDNPDAYLITAKPRYSNPTPETMVSRNTIRYAVINLQKKAEIDKPMNPHSIRHNFVTIAKRDYKMDDSTVKHLIGHAPDSSVMERTYSHLSDEDHIRSAEAAAGIREPDDESTLSPDICHCGEPLPGNAKACPRCGTVYAPDAQAAKETVEDSLKESYKQADPNDTDTMGKIDQLDDLLDDPEVKAALLEKLQE